MQMLSGYIRKNNKITFHLKDTQNITNNVENSVVLCIRKPNGNYCSCFGYEEKLFMHVFFKCDLIDTFKIIRMLNLMR